MADRPTARPRRFDRRGKRHRSVATRADPAPRLRRDSRTRLNLGCNRIRLHLAFKSGNNSRPFPRATLPRKLVKAIAERRSPTRDIGMQSIRDLIGRVSLIARELSAYRSLINGVPSGFYRELTHLELFDELYIFSPF